MMLELLFKLIVGHAIADYALQSEAMSRYKNWRTPPVPPPEQGPVVCWFYWLIAHAFINGGVVYFLTNSLLLGILETVAHLVIDFFKLRNSISLHVDQFLHILCKILWAYYLYFLI